MLLSDSLDCSEVDFEVRYYEFTSKFISSFIVHTMEELKLTGNHLRGSRPILTFSSNFDKDAHWKLLKEMITQVHLDMQLLIQIC